jgi:cyanate permease
MGIIKKKYSVFFRMFTIALIQKLIPSHIKRYTQKYLIIILGILQLLFVIILYTIIKSAFLNL